MLLQTKFHMPTVRTALVARPRLRDKLQAGQTGKVTLVCAPAGFGKTTVVTEWLRMLDNELSVAWLSLDKSDNDPTQFWDYVVGAIHKATVLIGRANQPTLPTPERPQPNAVIIALLNTLAAQRRPLLLALDDYHLIDNPAIHEALLFLIEQMPPQVHLVLITRADPPLPLARLRVRREINELRAEDLRFTLAEVATFLNQIMGLKLTTSQVATLEARTEGWVASLQLAALSLQNERDADRFIATFSGGHRHILDYLTEEALQHQPPTVRDFLLKTSILERMSAPLCDLLTRRTDSQAILTRLEQANLFVIPLDDHRHWYRYHHLFADLLRQLLHATSGDEGLALLHGQAARWFAEQGQTEDAIHHALAGHDYDLAAELIVAVELAVENKGNVYTLVTWYKALPETFLRARPKLTIRYAHKAMMNNYLDETDTILNSPWLADLTDPELLGEIAVLRGFTALRRRQFDRVLPYAQEALALLPATNDFYGGIFMLEGYAEMERGYLEVAALAMQQAATWNQAAGRTRGAIESYCMVAFIYQQQAKTAEADQVLRTCLKLVEGTDWTAEGDVYNQLAWSHLRRGEWSLAEPYLRKGLAIYENTGEARLPLYALLDLAFLKRLQRDLAAANAWLHKAQQLAPSAKDTWGDMQIERTEVELAWHQGNPDPMRRWLQSEPTWKTEFAIDYKVTRFHYQILLATAAPNPALPPQLFTELAALLADAEKKRNLYHQTFLLALLALAEASLGHNEEAHTHLQRVFDLAEPTGYLLSFLVNGKPMQTLVQQASEVGVGGEFAHKILRAFQQLTTDADQPPSLDSSPRPLDEGTTIISPKHFVATPVLLEPLTAREHEVLTLIVTGSTNQEIAEQLVVSVATVKRHISNLYGKLGVEHRTQAIARARELRLL